MKNDITPEEQKRAGTRSRAKDGQMGLSDEIARLETEAPTHETEKERAETEREMKKGKA